MVDNFKNLTSLFFKIWVKKYFIGRRLKTTYKKCKKRQQIKKSSKTDSISTLSGYNVYKNKKVSDYRLWVKDTLKL